MADGRFVSYCRVSTARQGASGLGLEAQQEAIRSYLNGGQWSLMAEVVEVESGPRSDRPKLAEALRLCKVHGATLIIGKLDRLARNAAFVSSLMEAGVEFTACHFPQANRLTIHILAAVAEHEAAIISARTKAALAAAKARGTKLGGLRGKAFTEADHAAAKQARTAAAVARGADLAQTVREDAGFRRDHPRRACQGAHLGRHRDGQGQGDVVADAGVTAAGDDGGSSLPHRAYPPRAHRPSPCRWHLPR